MGQIFTVNDEKNTEKRNFLIFFIDQKMTLQTIAEAFLAVLPWRYKFIINHLHQDLKFLVEQNKILQQVQMTKGSIALELK